MIERTLYFRMNISSTIIKIIILCVILLWATSIPTNLNNMSISGRIDKNRTREIETFRT